MGLDRYPAMESARWLRLFLARAGGAGDGGWGTGDWLVKFDGGGSGVRPDGFLFGGDDGGRRTEGKRREYRSSRMCSAFRDILK